MQTKSRKLLSVLLAFLMMAGVIAVAPVTASAAAAPGDKVFFGKYPQPWYTPTSPPASPTEGNIYTDADGTEFMRKGSTYYKIEPIEWRVLASSSGKLLLLSEKILDIKPFHPTWVEMTWEDSGMRAFLNGIGSIANPYDYSFIGRAFSAAEQAAIQTTTVHTPDNDPRRTLGGNDTNDKIFLLSMEEVSEYDAFYNRVAVLTNFGGSAYEGGNKYYWCLRSPGLGVIYASPPRSEFPYTKSGYTAEVSPEGVIGEGRETGNAIGVRPAMWVNESSLPAPHTHAWSDWKTDVIGHWKECACGEKSSQGAHTYGGWTEDIPPTTDTAGSQHRTCTTCGYVDTQSIPATGGGGTPDKGIFGTNPRWYGAWWHYLLFFIGFGFLWMWF